MLDETTFIAHWGNSQTLCAIPPAASGPEPEPDPLIGSELGCYRIESFLGAGGMGRVYLAHHRELHRPCALKILNPDRIATDPHYLQRFLDEGRAAAGLVHPNIITIHALGQDAGLYFLEMEYIAGRSLRQVIEEEGRVDPIRAISLVHRTSEGLAWAHGRGIVHRDLKPDNVLVSLHGTPKISDFGLCKRLGIDQVHHQGELCGTPHYIAPEVFEGQPATPTSDVYALGVTLYHLLTGAFPFHAETLPGLAAQVTSAEPLSLRSQRPDLPLELCEVVSLLIERSPARRPGTAIEASALLSAILGDRLDLGSLIQQALAHDPSIDIQSRDGRFELLVRLPAHRRQRVFVQPSPPSSAENLIEISSRCGHAAPHLFELALRINGEMSHGRISVQGTGQDSEFYVCDAYPRATLDPEELRRSVHEIAARADAIELLLNDHDQH